MAVLDRWAWEELGEHEVTEHFVAFEVRLKDLKPQRGKYI